MSNPWVLPSNQKGDKPESERAAPPANDNPWVLPTSTEKGEAPQRRTAKQELGRQLGLTARAAIAGPMKSAKGIVGPIIDAALPGQPVMSGDVDQTLTSLGLPEPENATERVVQDASQFVSGEAPFMAAGKVPGLSILSKAPTLQGLAAAFGGASSGVAREAGFGPVGQAVAGLAGGMFPGGAAMFGQSARRGFTNPGQVTQNIEKYRAAGIEPTWGQATGNQKAEAITGQSMGGGPIVDRIDQQVEDVAESIRNAASDVAPKTSRTRVGEEIIEGIRGKDNPNSYMARTADESKANYTDLYKIGVDLKKKPSKLDTTLDFLTTRNAMSDELPSVSKRMQGQWLTDIRKDLQKDLEAGNGTISYEALEQLRTKVGQKLDDSIWNSDLPRAEIKSMYKALTEDMKATVLEAAGPNKSSKDAAMKTWNRAMSFWEKRQRELEKIERVIGSKTGKRPERVYHDLINSANSGPTDIKAIYSALTPEESNMFTSTLIHNMGMAKPGQQNAAGTAESFGTFMTNWNKLDNGAKDAIFQNNPQLRSTIERALPIMEDHKATAQRYLNTSKTGMITEAAALGGVLTNAVMTGNLPLGAAVIAKPLLARRLARGMTNERIIDWMANESDLTGPAALAAINALAQGAADNNDLQAAEFAAELQKEFNAQTDLPPAPQEVMQ